MTDNTQPEAVMQLADAYAEASFDQRLHKRTLDDAPENARSVLAAAVRRQHTRIAELEAQLEAIGAGGMSGPLMGRTPLAASAGSEPVAFELPPTPFKSFAPGVEIGYDLFGGADIRLGGEFVYVHINYDHRYTHNSARMVLAEQIAGILSGSLVTHPSPPEGMVGGWSKGVEAAAALLSKKADDFARENGYDDMGSLSFGSGSHADAKLDYHSSLIELAEEVRAMLNAHPTTSAGSGKGE